MGKSLSSTMTSAAPHGQPALEQLSPFSCGVDNVEQNLTERFKRCIGHMSRSLLNVTCMYRLARVSGLFTDTLISSTWSLRSSAGRHVSHNFELLVVHSDICIPSACLHPRRPQVLGEAPHHVYHRLLRRLGCVALRYELAEVRGGLQRASGSAACNALQFLIPVARASILSMLV